MSIFVLSGLDLNFFLRSLRIDDLRMKMMNIKLPLDTLRIPNTSEKNLLSTKKEKTSKIQRIPVTRKSFVKMMTFSLVLFFFRFFLKFKESNLGEWKILPDRGSDIADVNHGGNVAN